MARQAGQIINRGRNKWLVRVYLGKDPETGKRRYHNKTVHGRKKDAQAYLNKVLRQRDLGTFVEPSTETLDAYLDRWLEVAVKPRVRERTHLDYCGQLQRYIRPKLGDRPLARISPVEIQELYTDLLGQGLSARTVRYAHTLLRNALQQAVRWGLLSRNPADLVDLPRREHREMEVLMKEQVGHFLDAAQSDPYYALFTLAVTTGMRSGELLGLQWKDVNFSKGTIQVRRTLVRLRNGKEWHFAKPKTAHSRRQVTLPNSVVRVLRTHRKHQAEERLAVGDAYENLDLVFADDRGQPLHHTSLYHRHFKPLLKNAGLPDIRFHDLRHTCATLLLIAGENPKVVSERLGDSSVTLTLDTYSHVLPNLQERAADKLERLLFAT